MLSYNTKKKVYQKENTMSCLQTSTIRQQSDWIIFSYQWSM